MVVVVVDVAIVVANIALMSTQSTLSFISQEEDGAPSFAPIVAPPEITWNNRRWVYLDHRLNRRRGAKISIAWELGDEYFDMNDPNSRAWRCQLCHPSNTLISMHQGSTGAATGHLRLKHQRSIPAMSAEVERVFSTAKRLVTVDRNRLNDELMETLSLLRYWWTSTKITVLAL